MSPLVVGGAIANLVLLAALAIVYFLFPATWQRLIHLRDSGPAPLARGADLVVLADTVPWGALSLGDGLAPLATPSGTASPQATAQPTATPKPATTPQASPTVTASTALQPAGSVGAYAYFRLTRGTHTLIYIAAPFETLTCQISVPAAKGDTCPLAQIPPSDAVRALGAARVVDASATVDHLPADEQKALFAAISTALTPPATTVRPYEHYLNPSSQVVLTYASLQATLQYAVNTDAAHAIPLPAPPAASATPTGSPAATAAPTATAAALGTPSATPTQPTTCVSLCDDPAATGAPTDAWNQLANLVPSWSYQPSRGAAIVAPAASQGSAATSVVVSIKWSDQWQVTAKDADKAGLLASAVTADAGALHMPSGWTVSAFPAANPADGYLVLAGPSGGAPAQLLYRFGVLLTVNSLAYSTFPSLPRASSAERVEASGIKTQ